MPFLVNYRWDTLRCMLHWQESTARGECYRERPKIGVNGGCRCTASCRHSSSFQRPQSPSLRPCPTKGGTNEENVSGSMPCLPGVECRARTGENKRSVEVRQTFGSAQHSDRRQAGSRLCDRTDQLYGYQRRNRRKQDEIR